jgi:beta-lactamase superfamily II metal-dependent hydrolase
MEIRIFDVEHGFCAYIIADNRNVMLIDCGHNTKTGFCPTNYLMANGCTGIERFIVSNYDEDHLSDMPNLREKLPIEVLRRNQSVSASDLRRLKASSGPIQPGTQALLEMIESYTNNITNPPEFPEIELRTFHNDYPIFNDTNNLSLVTFIHCHGIHLAYPGDIGEAGWVALLKNRSFIEHLARVNLFIASHHGRESGYYPEAFDYFRPDLIIISDEAIKYDTQDVDYSKHAKGVPWEDRTTKYVLTTRKNGMIKISERSGYNYYILTER